MPEKKLRVAVIGGGIAGLTAAWELVDRGFEVMLFDSSVLLGGKLGANPMRLTLRMLMNQPKGEDAGRLDDSAVESQETLAIRTTAQQPVRTDRTLSDAELSELIGDLER